MRWTSARDVLDRIGGPYAVTLRGLLLIAIPSLAPTVVFDRAINGGSVLTWGLVGFLGTAVGGVAYLGLGRILLPQRPRKPRPITALTVFFIAGVVRGTTIALLSVEMGVSASPQWVFRITGGAALGVCWFALVAIIVDAWTRHHDALIDLHERQEVARAQRAEAEERLRRMRERIRDTLLTQMSAIVSLLTSVMHADRDPATARSLAAVMHTTVTDVVRPLSHALATAETPAVAPPPRLPFRARSRRWLHAVSIDALRMDPYHPVLTVAVVTPSAIPGAVRIFGVAVGLLGVAAIALITWGILHVARRRHARHPVRQGRWSWLPAALTYAAVGIAAATVPAVASYLLDGDFWAGWAQGGQTIAILAPVAALGAAVFAAEDRRLAIAELEREAAVAQAEWSSHRVQQEAWAASHLIARELHGGVQSQLTAAALRLEDWARAPDPGALTAVLTQVTQAVDRVNSLVAEEFQPSSVDAEDAISRIIEVWAGLATVLLDIEHTARTSIADDPAAAETVIEVVRECLGNAVSHGHARRVHVVIRRTRHDVLQVTVDDDGRGIPANATAGMGSRLLSETCLRWARVSRAPLPGTRVSATIPVGTLRSEGEPVRETLTA